MFVMISGALFLRPEKEVTYREILKTRIPRLLLVYVIWSVLYAVHCAAKTGFVGFSAKSIFGSHFHLWYLPMLMAIYLLIPILRKIAQDEELLCYALSIWMVYVLLLFFHQYSERFKWIYQVYLLFKKNMVVCFSGVFLLGYYLSSRSFSKRRRAWIYIFGAAGALVSVLGTYIVSVSNGKADERYMYGATINVMAMGAAVFVLVKQLTSKCGNALLRLNGFIRKDLFGVYLTHALWLPVVNTEAFRHCCSEIITLPLITIIVFILSLFTTKLIRLVPYLHKVVE